MQGRTFLKNYFHKPSVLGLTVRLLAIRFIFFFLAFAIYDFI